MQRLILKYLSKKIDYIERVNEDSCRIWVNGRAVDINGISAEQMATVLKGVEVRNRVVSQPPE